MLCSGRIFESSTVNSYWNKALASGSVPRFTAIQGKLLSILMGHIESRHRPGIGKRSRPLLPRFDRNYLCGRFANHVDQE